MGTEKEAARGGEPSGNCNASDTGAATLLGATLSVQWQRILQDLHAQAERYGRPGLPWTRMRAHLPPGSVELREGRQALAIYRGSAL
jgi:hypothetical protein